MQEEGRQKMKRGGKGGGEEEDSGKGEEVKREGEKVR